MSLAKVKEIASKVRKQAVKKSKDPSLDCMCAICSYWIFKLCKDKKLDVRFIQNEGMDSVDKRKDDFWVVEKRFSSLRGVKEELRKWPHEQTPKGFDLWDDESKFHGDWCC